LPDPPLPGDEPVTAHFLSLAEPEDLWPRRDAPNDAESGEELERSELVHGYEFSKVRYAILTHDELKAIAMQLSKTIDLARFVDSSEVDVVHLDTPYYVAPEGKIGDETFKVLREAMDRSGKAGIGRVVLTGRDHPLVLRPHGKGMVLVGFTTDHGTVTAASDWGGVAERKRVRPALPGSLTLAAIS
jgi:DNA end-binding protein Ku